MLNCTQDVSQAIIGKFLMDESRQFEKVRRRRVSELGFDVRPFAGMGLGCVSLVHRILHAQRTYAFQFVEFIPKVLDEGVLYVSMTYATARHLCFCGCGMRVVRW